MCLFRNFRRNTFNLISTLLTDTRKSPWRCREAFVKQNLDVEVESLRTEGFPTCLWLVDQSDNKLFVIFTKEVTDQLNLP